jgi:branched-chain amino acid transport system substrate-binding protein
VIAPGQRIGSLVGMLRTATLTLRRAGAPTALIFALALGACSKSTTTSPNPSGSPSAGKTLQLGAVLSLTGPGGIYGPQQKNGIGLAVDEINRNGINGAKIAVDIRDDASDKSQGQQQFQTLIQQGNVLAIIGPTLSNTAVGAHPVAQQNHTPAMATSNTANGIVGTCAYGPCDYIFRDCLGEATAIPANLKVAVARFHPTTVVLAYANDDKFSSDGAQIFKDAFAAQGLRLLNTVAFSKTVTDFSSYATTIVGSRPDVLAISGVGGVPSKLIGEVRRQGFTKPIIGGNGFNSSQVSTQAGQAGLGAQSGSAWFLGTTTTANTNFVTAYRARFSADPDQFAAQAYTAVYLYAEAFKNAHLTFTDVAKDRDAIKVALESVALDTPLGHFSFTANHDVHQPIYVVAMDGKGGFTLVETVQPS